MATYNPLPFKQVRRRPLAVTLPGLVPAIMAQRQIAAGLTTGTMKGG